MWRQQVERFLARNLAPLLVFLVIASLQGAYYMEAVGPLSMPDPDLHATTSYAVATGQAFNPTTTKTDEHGNTVKVQHLTGDSRFLENEAFRNILVSSVLDKPFTRDKHIGLQQGADRETPRMVTIPNVHVRNRSNQYFPIAYLPQGLGLALGMHGGHSPYECWQMARQTNLIMFLILFSLAIALTPRAKFLVVLVGALPQVAFISSSLMADATYIGVSACFVGMLLHLADKKSSARWWELTALIALIVLLFFCKVVYVLEALLVLVLPSAVVSWKRKGLVVGLSVLLGVVPYVLWHNRFGGMLARVNVADNIGFMIHYPVRVLKIILWNVLQLPQTLGDVPASSSVAVAAMALGWVLVMARTSRIDRPDSMLGWLSAYRYSIVAVVAALLATMLIYLSLMVTWMNMPKLPLTGEIEGFQGRYLLPLLPLLLCSTAVSSVPTATLSTGTGMKG